MFFTAKQDFAYSTVATPPSPAGSGLSLTLAAGEGSRFPTLSTGQVFYAVVVAAGQSPIWASGGNTGGNFEVVRVTAISGDVVTIDRAQLGTSARTVLAGDQFYLADLKKLWSDIEGSLYGKPITDQATDRTPSTISNTLYNAFGIMGHFPASGKYIIVYREGHKHGGTGEYGAIRYRTSTDEGFTWSAATTIDDGSAHTPNVDLRDVGGGVTRTGRIVIWYGTYNAAAFTNPGGGGYPLSLGYRYSDDEGKTWSNFTTINTGANNYTFAAIGTMVEIANGRLMKTWYGATITGGAEGTASVYAIFSDDNGATWGNQVTIASSASINYDESSCAYLGGEYIVVVVRKSNGTVFRQFQSADNGATWVDEGDTSFDSWTTPSPPALVTYLTANGGRMVALYYTNRDAGKLRVVTASSAALQASAASAWSTPTDIVTGFTSTDFGYIGVVHPFGYGRGIGWLYKGISTSQADIVFFTSSLGVITETDIGLSDVTTDDASTARHGFLKKLSGVVANFLDGTGVWRAIVESDISLSDVTTDNVSTTKHGFTPKAPNDTTKFLRGDGTWATPTSGQHILLADGHATPFAFTDMLQMDDGSDFMWND